MFLNPIGETPEEFLLREGRVISISELRKWDFFSGGKEFPVVLMGNGPFKSASVACDNPTIQALTDPSDPSRKQYYAVKSVTLLSIPLSKTSYPIFKGK